MVYLIGYGSVLNNFSVFGDFGKFLDTFSEDLSKSSPILRIILTLCIVIIVQLIFHVFIDRLIEQTVRHSKYSSHQEEHKREATLKTVFHTTSTIVIWLTGIIVILMQLNINIGALLTGAGLVGVVAGLGAQNLIKDCLAGLFIILENQMRVDDIVTLATPTATVSGSVEEVTIRTTRLRDLDGNLHILTNGAIGVITNQSFQFAQVNLNFDLNYNTDIDLVEKLIKQAGAQTARSTLFADSTIEPITFLRVDSINEASVTVKALGKVKPGTQYDVAGDFRRNLKRLFDEHKIMAPYQSIVVIREAKKPSDT